MTETGGKFSKKLLPFLAILLFTILPFLVLSFFNHPQNDDYVAAASAKALGFLDANIRWYNIWSARYYVTAIMSGVLNPLLMGSFFAYKMTAAITLVALVYAIHLFTAEFIPAARAAGHSVGCDLALTAAYLLQVPSISDSFFWMSGALCYQHSIIFMLLMLALGLKLRHERATGRSAVLMLLIASFLLVNAGTNEISMVLQLEAVALLIIYGLYQRKTVTGASALFLLVSLIGFCIVFFSPGLKARSSYGKKDLWFAVSASLVHGSKYIVQWLWTTPIVPLVILFGNFLNSTKASLLKKQALLPVSVHPLLFFGLFLMTYFGMYFPSFYGVGTLELHTVSMIYFFFLFGLFLGCALVVQHYRIPDSGAPSPALRRLLLASWIAVALLTIAPDSNVRTAYADLLSGDAYRYNREQQERYDAIQACPSLVCTVNPIRSKPKTLFWWENAVIEKSDTPFLYQYKDNSFAFYFNKRHIRVSE